MFAASLGALIVKVITGVADLKMYPIAGGVQV
jgi:hypothetical protein